MTDELEPAQNPPSGEGVSETPPPVAAPAEPAPEPVPEPAPAPDPAPDPAPAVAAPVPPTVETAPPREVPVPDPTQATAPAKPMRTGAVIAIAAVLAFVIASFSGLAAGFLGVRLANTGSLDMTSPPASVSRPPVSSSSEPVVAAAEAAVPSVVNIDVRGSGSSRNGAIPEGHPGVPSMGNGSGVAYKSATDDGTYVITNNHVVESADSITVRDSTGESYPAQLVGRDPETDIAVVKVDADIPTIEIGDSESLLVGQAVVAIGSPFGLEHSVTSGVVSALGRSLPDFGGESSSVYPLVDVIQTDAAINPGNSGGALVTTAGQLIGINTAIYSESGASGGIGFAVPVNTAVRVSDQLIEGGEINHPFIGVIGQTVTPELVEQNNLAVQQGAYVAEIAAGSGAQRAGVRTGDVITAVDDERIRTMDDLILQVRRKSVGDTVKLTVARGSQTIDIDVVVGDKPADISSEGTTGSVTPE